MNKTAGLLAAMTAIAFAMPASAAPVTADPPARGRALLLTPLTLTKLSDLHFGTIIPSAISGTVTVPADGSAPIVAGGISLVPSDPPVRAYFAGAGSANQNVFVWATNPGTLSDGFGNTVTVLALTIEGSPLKTIDATRAFYFHVGGILQVGANQTEGVYSADMDVTANYL